MRTFTTVAKKAKGKRPFTIVEVDEEEEEELIRSDEEDTDEEEEENVPLEDDESDGSIQDD